MTVSLGIVHDEKVDAKWVLCLLRLETALSDLLDQTIMVEGSVGSFDVGRNKVVDFFLSKTESDYLLTLDTDMLFLPEHLTGLLARDKSVCSGAYFINDNPPRLCAARRDEKGHLRRVEDWEDGELFEVDAVGHGFCLIRRDVFTDIGEQDDVRFGPWYRQDAVGANGWPLEPDYAFCQRAQQAGHTIWIDPDVFLGHNKPRVLGWQT